MQSPPYDDKELFPALPPERPTTAIPKTIGILNNVFGSLLLLCAICSSMNLLLQSAMAPVMAMQQQQFQQVMQAEHQQQIQKLKEQEKAAANEKEKAELREKQKTLQTPPAPKMPDMTKFMQDETFWTYTIVEVGTALLLNILMVISGIGLLRYQEWGRVSALWVAALKIIRLIAVYTYYILVIVPLMVQQIMAMFQEMFDEIARTAPPGQKLPTQAELAQLGKVMGTIMTAFAICMVLFGVIYPIVVLALLTRPRAKSACAAPAAPAQNQALPPPASETGIKPTSSL